MTAISNNTGAAYLRKVMRTRRREPTEPQAKTRDTRYCEEIGCEKATSEKKDRCTAHIDKRDYVQGVLKRIEQIELENLMVLRHGVKHCKPEHNTAQETIQFLRSNGGVMTIKGLRKLLQVDVKIAKAYVRMLSKNGIVTTKKNKRKILEITLNDA